MSQYEIHLDDVGTIFEITVMDGNVVIDISSASTKEIIFRKPDGTKVTHTAAFVTDGTDGKMKYIAIADDLNAIGEWLIQGKIIITAGTWYTDIKKFPVHDNI